MKNILKRIAYRYLDSVDVYMTVSLLLIPLVFFYRIDLYCSFIDAFKELRFITASDFVTLSLKNDAYTIFLCMALLLPVLILTPFGRRGRNAAASVFMILISNILFLSVEFFKVYEFSFNPGLLDNEVLSGWRDLLYSAFHELTPSFYVKSLLSLALFSPPVINLMYSRFRFINILKTHRGTFLEKVFIYYPPAAMALFILLPALTGSEAYSHGILDRIRTLKSESFMINAREMAGNPVKSFFFHKISENRTGIGAVKEQLDKTDFSCGLDTSSVFSERMNPKKNLIKRGERYNIILYFFESTSSRYLNERVNGRLVAPNWVNLMKNSFVAKNHYANFPLSANSLYTVLTSSYDKYSKDLVLQRYPKIKRRTIYEILSEKGYRTSLIHTGSLLYAGQKKFLENRKIDRIIEYSDLAKNSGYRKIVGYGIDERAMIKPGIDFIKEDRSRPFLISFLPLNPHHPYAIPDRGFRITGKIPENTGRKKRRWMDYINSLHFSDHAMGGLVRELEKNGLMENTLLVLFADHGQAFYQHRGNFNHRRFLYEENVHVPFLIYNKNIFRNTFYYSGISSHVDILPTIMDILDIDPGKNMEGVSLLSSHRQQYALLHTWWNHEFFGVRDENWKYIFRVEDGYEELYDLRKDPDEKENLAIKSGSSLAIFRHLVSKARLYNHKYYEKITGRYQQ